MATAITWSVSTDGSTWVTPASCGMEKLVLTLRANGVDEFTWMVAGNYDATAGWAYASTIYLRQTVTTDGTAVSTVRFIGRVEGIPRQAQGVIESVSYRAVGGWWWLERITFSNSWMVFRQSDGTQYSVPTPRVILGQAPDGSTQSMGAAITAAVNLAISRGAPMQLGTVDTLVVMPLDEQTNLTCADAIRYALRLMPDIVCWFDYNTTSAGAYVPTFHCRQAANLTAAGITLPAAAAAVVTLTPRYDLQVPGIRIVFESTFAIDGKQRPIVTLDTAGSLTDPRCLDLLYDLAGGSAEYIKQDIEVAEYPESPYTDRAFWRSMLPWLAEIDDADLVITDVDRDGELALGGYLLKGAMSDWMDIDNEEETWTATIAYTRRDSGSNKVEQVENKKVSITLTSVDAAATTPGTPRTCQKLVAWDSGETVPTGVAAAIYASWSRLHWDGRVRLEEQEVTFAAGPRNVVNLTGGRSEWTTMADIVQEATYALDRGTTDLSIGSGGRWEADSLVALYRAARNRRFAWHLNVREDPTKSGSAIEGPKAAAQKVADTGDPGEAKVNRWHGTDSGSRSQVVVIDPSSMTFGASGDAAAKTLQLREVRILEKQVDGTYKAKLCQVLCSDIYDAAGGDAVGGISLTGSAAGQVIYWNGSAWAVAVVGTVASGDLLQWDGSKWAKLTPSQITVVTDVQIDTTNHVVQKKTRTAYVLSPGSESSWTTITGGTMAQGVVPS